ncbi:hypothetical protein [Mucilaginibacter jinjuensis]|uniref:Uncharacterized protein n=1 Tax=Mucilaginibacter jinjuensis TaxID=1176721 RepID=A0ABY7TFH8_9SPHI|nr:hypothetical protein [Mucilaginibacter jinjuensis]WCT14367.1 hypothetical protein PQO05_10525 [Mucilaginibacter jinjuensis]
MNEIETIEHYRNYLRLNSNQVPAYSQQIIEPAPARIYTIIGYCSRD